MDNTSEMEGDSKGKVLKSETGKQSLIDNLDKVIFNINNEVEMFSRAINDTEITYGKNDEAEKFATLFPYLELSLLDIIILYKQYLLTTNNIELNFICRTASHHMCEFLEDASKALGKELNITIDNLNEQNLIDYIKNLRRNFNDLKNQLHKSLKIIRNNVSGHKDRNVRNQLKISKDIETVDFHLNFVLFLLFYTSFSKFKKMIVLEIKRQQNESN